MKAIESLLEYLNSETYQKQQRLNNRDTRILGKIDHSFTNEDALINIKKCLLKPKKVIAPMKLKYRRYDRLYGLECLFDGGFWLGCIFTSLQHKVLKSGLKITSLQPNEVFINQGNDYKRGVLLNFSTGELSLAGTTPLNKNDVPIVMEFIKKSSIEWQVWYKKLEIEKLRKYRKCSD